MLKKIAIILCLALHIHAFGQIQHPKASPFSIVEQEVGLASLRVEYSRPSTNGREIFGNLVPYDRIWRVGANISTKITVSSTMEVMGNVLPKGTYALYAFPEAEAWEVVFHTNTSHWGDGRNDYDPQEDLFRIKVQPESIPYYQENFLIAFDSITHNSVNMQLIWANTQVVVPFSVDTHAQMKAEIENQIAKSPTAQTYYEAARYLQEQGKDYEKALAYLNKALELGGDTYYFHRVKSLVEAAMGDYNSAIQSAEKSLKISKDLEKDEFVRMNEAKIQKWKAILEKE
ncbi:DUF2911 domain-containing protein [Muricauda sp. CAU 1633]|uniref:DUF2911 domain-containing protein n=1 Tax=Allomuricauda sp. CAU 1633 TaxID=2816036 RepID=UPI001A8CCEE0|nr:DUF2911 domain-containing protein [Muricauda sp. CAU 1633]MBO0324254.1 DUF2911 domain-containing protein [Muricauda sp. CAU 1633]